MHHGNAWCMRINELILQMSDSQGTLPQRRLAVLGPAAVDVAGPLAPTVTV